MNHVLIDACFYLALVAFIFFSVGKIIGIKVDARNKILQKAKEQFNYEMTLKEALETRTEEARKRYKKNCLNQDACLVILGIAFIILLASVSTKISSWNSSEFSTLICILLFIDAAVLFLLAYKSASYFDDYYYEDNDEVKEKRMWYNIAGNWIKNDVCKKIDVVKVNDVYTLAYAENEEGTVINVSYLDASKLTDNVGQLHLNEELMTYLLHIKEVAKENIAIDEVTSSD